MSDTNTRTAADEVVANLALVTEPTDIERIIDAIKAAQTRISVQLKRTFRVHDRVSFEGRNGTTVHGKVVKLLKKNVRVQADDGVTWTVSPGLLTKENAR